MANSSLPQPDNPLVLKYVGKVPALKNNKNLVKQPQYLKAADGNPILQDGKRVIVGYDFKPVSNKSVSTFLRKMENSLQQQVRDSGLARMAFPLKVAVWVDIVFFLKAKHGIPKSDADNAYTMIQETLQALDKPSGLADVIDDDRQVMSASFDLTVTPNRALQGATAFLWVQPEGMSYREQLARFLIYDAKRKSRRAQAVELPELIRETLFNAVILGKE